MMLSVSDGRSDQPEARMEILTEVTVAKKVAKKAAAKKPAAKKVAKKKPAKKAKCSCK
jgi:hypothetical protein